MYIVSVIFLVSVAVTFVGFWVMIPALKRAGITVKDVHKPSQPEIATMGGLATVTGFSFGILVAVALKSFTGLFSSIALIAVLAAFSTILIVGLIGILDDLLLMRQWIKAILPVFAALPLMAIKVGDTTMTMPFVGLVDFGILYPLILVPIGITVVANAVNMLAGFNGLEAGMATVAIGSLTIIAYSLGETTALVILFAALGSLLVTICFNWYPAKVFIGDVGTLSIGAIIASAVIIGNFETAGVIIIIPHALDFVLKAFHRFPKSFGVYKNGKLHCSESGVVGLGQLIMRLTGGISERNLTLTLMGIEAICGAVAVWMFW